MVRVPGGLKAPPVSDSEYTTEVSAGCNLLDPSQTTEINQQERSHTYFLKGCWAKYVMGQESGLIAREDLTSRVCTVVLPVQDEAFQQSSVGDPFVIIVHTLLVHKEYRRLLSHDCTQNPSPKQELSLVLFALKYCIHLSFSYTVSHTFGARSSTAVKLLAFFWWLTGFW